jgi:predicted flap endonuclease-1-like 5' DNA nuclease
VVDLDRETALAWLQAGYAEPIASTPAQRREQAVKPPPERRDLELLPGIGPARAAELRELGIASVGALADAEPELIASIDGVGLATARRWIEAAQEA